MVKRSSLSWQTRQNWMVDATLFLGALVATLSGIYFLFLPVGGYQGGRNPAYGVTVLFGRETWDDFHTWGGLLMIIAVVLHLALHWSWVAMMARRLVRAMARKGSQFSRGAIINILIDLCIALGFFVTAISGIYFLVLPSGYEGGRNPAWDPGFLFSRATWDILHTWGFIVMILAAVLHIVIHWRWIVNVTRRIWLSWWSRTAHRNQPTVNTITQ